MKTLNKIQTALLALVIIVAIPFSVYAVDGQRKISQTPSTTFPITINQSGSYVLTSNLVVTNPNVNAIEITDSHITLDLNGHMVRGPNSGGTGNGINSLDQYNITIKNGSIWGFGGAGIDLNAYPEAQFEIGNCVKDIQAFLNGGGGIGIYAGLVTNCTANNNSGNGISAYYSTVTNCTANDNGYSGFYTWYTTVTNCTAINNAFDGINARNCTITNCTTFENDGVGISGEDTTITNCTANNNGNMGISALISIITNCRATGNGSDGIGAQSWNRIEGNNLRYNGLGGTGYGLNITGDNNYVVKNAASDNTSGNFQNTGSNNVLPFTGDTANYWSP